MNILELLRKGLGYMLLCMGVSSPGKKSGATAKPASQAGAGTQDSPRGSPAKSATD